MDLTLLITTLANTLVLAGVFYGSTNARLKALEQNGKQAQETVDRLARLEEKVNFLIELNRNK